MRNLASVQIIKSLDPIENSDFLERAGILGWGVVVKKGQFSVGEKCIFFEIDSLLPDEPQYEFLKKTSDQKQIRLKTLKLRGCLSQGLALKLSDFPNLSSDLEVGTDVSEILNIEKYEPQIPAKLAGDIKSYTWKISKTDETRCQTSPEKFIGELNGKGYYVSVKLDGTSSSFILSDEGYEVCSRNYSLKEKEGNAYWIISNKYNIKEILESYKEKTGVNISLQGEICGPGIQGNKLNLDEIDLFVFNVVETDTNIRFPFDDFVTFCKFNGLKTVPILEQGDSFNYSSLEELFALSEGKYKEHFDTAKKNQEKEGIVIRSKDQSVSFKVINNKFLLDGGD